jgi:hypothetical protein
MTVPTAPRQKMIQPSAYGRNIRELGISQIVTLKADVRKEISYSIRAKRASRQVAPPSALF